MKTELERTQRALNIAVDALRVAYDTERNQIISVRLAEITRILEPPPPEMEEFETKAFRCPSCRRLHETDANDCACGKYCSQFIKLTGTHQRPKPQKVDRSVSVKAAIVPEGRILVDIFESLRTSDVHDSGCLGKSGTLTFAWTE